MSVFSNPRFTAMQPLLTDTTGYLRGHIARPGSFPETGNDYSVFHTDRIGGQLVGHVTESPFARITFDAAETRAHYDRLSRIVADVVVGDDEFGIWYAGQLRDNTLDVSNMAMAADFRAVNGRLTLVQLVLVAVPALGYPLSVAPPR